MPGPLHAFPPEAAQRAMPPPPPPRLSSGALAWDQTLQQVYSMVDRVAQAGKDITEEQGRLNAAEVREDQATTECALASRSVDSAEQRHNARVAEAVHFARNTNNGVGASESLMDKVNTIPARVLTTHKPAIAKPGEIRQGKHSVLQYAMHMRVAASCATAWPEA
eukprot:scaffold326954_cov167-Tisochrysis_lutea.AAC.1